jgi:hypothetical protein
MKKFWMKNRYDIKDSMKIIGAGFVIGVISNSLLLIRIKRIVKK